MTHLPPDPDAAGDDAAVDWQALLAGGAAPPERPATQYRGQVDPRQANAGRADPGQAGGGQWHTGAPQGAQQYPAPGNGGPVHPDRGQPGHPGQSGQTNGAPSYPGRPNSAQPDGTLGAPRAPRLGGGAGLGDSTPQFPAPAAPTWTGSGPTTHPASLAHDGSAPDGSAPDGSAFEAAAPAGSAPTHDESGRPLTRREAREVERQREAELHGTDADEGTGPRSGDTAPYGAAPAGWGSGQPDPFAGLVAPDARYGQDSGYLSQDAPSQQDVGYAPDAGYPGDATYAQDTAYWQGADHPQDGGYAGDAAYPQDAAYPHDAAYPQDAAYPHDAAYPQDAAYPRDAEYLSDAEYRQHDDPRSELGFPFAEEPSTASTNARPSRAERREMAAIDELHATHDEPHAPKRRRRGAWGCLIALLVVVALGVGAYFVLQGPITAIIERFQPAADYSGQGTGEVLFSVEEGDTGTSIGARLVEEDIVASEDAFLEAIAAQGEAPTFYPGVYRMSQQMSAQAALDALLDDANRMENTVLLREGVWARDALAEASTVLGIPIEELQAAAANPQALGLPAEATSVEGFLFPATYTFEPGVTAQQVVQTMVDRALEEYDAAGVAPEDRLRVATIASLVEREGLPQDFGKVSRVIQNRLDQGMLLQFDSTVHYGLADDSVVTTTDAEREDAANPYNTYVHAGLPPGPIGNPGAAAIQAALNPEPGEWLYFVTVNPDTGETVFTNTIEEHEAAAEQFYQWLEDHPDYGQ